MQGLETAALGRREVVGKVKGAQLAEAIAQALESGLDGGGTRRDAGHAARGRTQHRQRVAQQLAAVRRVGGPVRREQRERLACPQSVALDAPQQRVLVGGAQRRQRKGQGRSYSAAGELLAGARREPGADGPAARDPLGLVPEQACDGAGRQPVVVDERADDAGLVERADGARRGV
jgi:hypothetical protein